MCNPFPTACYTWSNGQHGTLCKSHNIFPKPTTPAAMDSAAYFSLIPLTMLVKACVQHCFPVFLWVKLKAQWGQDQEEGVRGKLSVTPYSLGWWVSCGLAAPSFTKPLGSLAQEQSTVAHSPAEMEKWTGQVQNSDFCVDVFARMRERQRERECMCVCVWERESERQRDQSTRCTHLVTCRTNLPDWSEKFVECGILDLPWCHIRV